VGTPDQVVERLLDMKRRGLGYAIYYMPELAYDRTGLELYEREVIPALR
jgi:alkanesulfonate monooxygenase SsuD/methylene tetrahydromethanopterin reductase-like flavin-dependent oxidoreductase (luciferase family)